MAPKAVDAVEAHRPDQSLSRPWAAPTTAWPFPTQVAPRALYRRGPWPRKRYAQGDAPTGTGAFAAMGRSYNSVAIPDAGGASRPLQEGPMAPKAVRAGRRPNRNRRFRGHGPLQQQRGHYRCSWRLVPSVGGAHGPESGTRREAPQPEPALSRPWAAPTTAWPFPMRVAPRALYRRGPWPRKRYAQGDAPTGTGAFAAMGRSYNNVAIPMRVAPRALCRRGPWPRKRRVQGNDSSKTRRRARVHPAAGRQGREAGPMRPVPVVTPDRGSPRRRGARSWTGPPPPTRPCRDCRDAQ